jgi:polar amino acid transport system substrate-binding protein
MRKIVYVVENIKIKLACCCKNNYTNHLLLLEKIMKKILSFILIGILISTLFLTVSCSKEKSVPVLKVGTNAEYPPFEFKKGNEFKGIDMDLDKLIAQKLGMRLEIVDMDFDSLIPSLGAKKIDMASAAITITDARKKVIDFSEAYYSVDQALISNKDAKITVNSEKDLANLTVGVQNGTTGQIYLDKNLVKKGIMPKENLKKYPTNIEAITDMLNGNVDLVILDSSAGDGYATLKPIKTVYTIKTGEHYGLALQKNSSLKGKINKALKEILNSDEWNKIIQTYIK